MSILILPGLSLNANFDATGDPSALPAGTSPWFHNTGVSIQRTFEEVRTPCLCTSMKSGVPPPTSRPCKGVQRSGHEIRVTLDYACDLGR